MLLVLFISILSKKMIFFLKNKLLLIIVQSQKYVLFFFISHSIFILYHIIKYIEHTIIIFSID